MKTRLLIILLSFAFAITACQKQDSIQPDTKKENKQQSSTKLRSLKQDLSKARSMFRTTSTMMNMSPRSLKARSLKQSDNDSTWYDDYESCATITEVTDDGNWVITFDYGTEGCEEYGMFTKGKIITTIYNTEDNKEKYKEEFIDFSFSYDECQDIDSVGNCVGEYVETMTMNGIIMIEEEYEGEDSWNGTFKFTEDLIFKFSDGEEIISKSVYEETETDEAWTLTIGDGFYKGKDWEFTFNITSPIVYLFSCDDDVYMPVRGIETGRYVGKDENGADESYEYSLDYGDGTCDNKATITENGVTEEIDFDDYYEDWDDEDWDEEEEDEEDEDEDQDEDDDDSDD